MADTKHVTHDELTSILGKAIDDDAFRSKLLADPKGALAAENYHPNPHAARFFELLHQKGFAHAASKVVKKGKKDPIELAGDN